jgi:hypothetical protein
MFFTFVPFEISLITIIGKFESIPGATFGLSMVEKWRGWG